MNVQPERGFAAALAPTPRGLVRAADCTAQYRTRWLSRVLPVLPLLGLLPILLLCAIGRAWLALWFVACLFGLALMQLVARLRHRVRLFPDALEVTTLRGNRRISFGSTLQIERRVEIVRVTLLHYTKVRLRISDGDHSVRLDQRTAGIDDLCQRMLEVERSHVTGPTLERYATGEAVRFGAFQVQSDMLYFNGRSFRRADLEGPDVINGVLRFGAPHKVLAVMRARVGNIPNFATFMAVLEKQAAALRSAPPAPVAPAQAQLASASRVALHPSYAKRQYALAAIALAVLMPIGAFAATYASFGVQDARRVAALWSSGRQTDGPYEIEGKVFTSRFIHKRYRLTLTYHTIEGVAHRVPVEFERFFGDPDLQAPLAIRYDPASGDAVTSLQHDSIVHTWLGACGLFAAAALAIFGSLLYALHILREVSLVQELARSGKLARVRVVDRKRLQWRNHSSLTVRYQTAAAHEHRQTFTNTTREPLSLTDRGDQALALTSQDGRRAVLICADGFPLARRPADDELRAIG